MNHLIQHPVIDDRLAKLRQYDCPDAAFKNGIHQISELMLPTVTADLASQEQEIETPLETAMARVLSRPIILAPILRAGLGMLDPFQRLLPEASVAHIGMARNEQNLHPETYYFKAPNHLSEADVIVIDPMLATGGTSCAALSELKKQGAKRLRFVCIVAAPEGLQRINSEHPDVPVYYPALDRGLNQHGYILPGLGDAGDRIFGTC